MSLVRVGDHHLNPAHVESLTVVSNPSTGVKHALVTTTTGRTFFERLRDSAPERHFSEIVNRFNA